MSARKYVTQGVSPMNTKVRSILVPPAFVLLIVAVALLVLVPVASAQTTQPPLPVVVRSTTIINVPTDQPTRQAVQGT